MREGTLVATAVHLAEGLARRLPGRLVREGNVATLGLHGDRRSSSTHGRGIHSYGES